ncbi:MAG: hypothetical protein F6K09_35050, partial [Merismopedia sp. SIO2A8]|nr:hypothetical protein [Merismopedia sp. SIO2A8]
LRNNNFDQHTKELIKLFQFCSGITVDGVVGFKTYTTLNECFGSKDKIESLKDKLEEYKEKILANPAQAKFKDSAYQGNSWLQTVKLRIIPSPLPPGILDAVFEELKSIFIKQIRSEVSAVFGRTVFFEYVFERFFLNQIGLKEPDDLNIFEKILQDSFEKCFPVGSSLNDFKNEDKLREFFNDAFAELLTSDSTNFIEVFLAEFITFEPVFSMILKTVSPLSIQKSQSRQETLHLGFEKFQELYVGKTSEHLDQESKQLNELAEQAVHKVLQLFDQNIKMIVGEKSCENDLTKQILLFYFLIKKYLNWLDCSKTKVKDNQAQVDHGIIHNIQLEQAKIARSDAPNRFDKQEFFEIQLFDEEDEELFQAAELAIPVSSKFLDLKNINFLEKQTQDLCGSENNSKPYFFFVE